MGETVLKVEGMSCMHCKMAVEKALGAVPGVTDVKVDLAAKEAVVKGSAELSAMTKAVADAGFEATSADTRG